MNRFTAPDATILIHLRSVMAAVILSLSFLPDPAVAQRHSNEDSDWIYLFDGTDLSLWNTYVGPVLNEHTDWSKIKELPAEALNTDTAQVFSIVDLEGSRVLRISGQTGGGISTREEFANYHLQFEFKWGDNKWFPREKSKRDSGLLYHGIGDHGDGDGFWLRSQELQIQEGDCGDYWGVAGAEFNIPAILNRDSVYQYKPDSDLLHFSAESPIGRHCKKYPDAENPTGEWNTVDLFCFGDDAIHVINGTTVMELYDSRILTDGKTNVLDKGKIEIQSEFSEVFYRNIRIRTINRLPKQ